MHVMINHKLTCSFLCTIERSFKTNILQEEHVSPNKTDKNEMDICQKSVNMYMYMNIHSAFHERILLYTEKY